MRAVLLAQRSQHDALQFGGGRNDGQKRFLALGCDLHLDRPASSGWLFFEISLRAVILLSISLSVLRSQLMRSARTDGSRDPIGTRHEQANCPV